MPKSLRTSWVTNYDPTTRTDTRTAAEVLACIEQSRYEAESRRTQRAREALKFLKVQLDPEAKAAFQDAVAFRKAIGSLDSSELATARALLGDGRDLLLRQAKAYATNLKS